MEAGEEDVVDVIVSPVIAAAAAPSVKQQEDAPSAAKQEVYTNTQIAQNLDDTCPV